MWRNFIFAVGVVIGIFSMAVVVMKTRDEVIKRSADRWTGTNETRMATGLNLLNPDILVPDPRAIIDGRATEALAKPATLAVHSRVVSRVRLEWPHDLLSVSLEDERGAESREVFIGRVVDDYTALSATFAPMERK